MVGNEVVAGFYFSRWVGSLFVVGMTELLEALPWSNWAEEWKFWMPGEELLLQYLPR